MSSLTAYHDFSIAGPGLKVTMALLSAEGFKLRQPRQSFAEFLDRALANGADPPPGDPDGMRGLVSMLSAYGVGRIGISGLDVATTGIDRFHLGGFSLSDLSIDRLGEFAIDDFAAAIQDQGSIAVGHFALGNVAFPGADAMLKAILADQAGEDVDVNGLIPKLGFVDIAHVDAQAVDLLPRTTLDSLRVDLSDYIGPVPTTVSANLGSLVVPVSMLKPSAQAVFAKLGYDQIDVSYRLKMNWQQADETVKVDDFNFNLKGAGALGLSMVLGGLPREAIENPEALQDVLPDLSLRTASITLQDDSIVGKGLDLLAEKMHAPPEKFRQQFADALPLMMSLFVLNDPQISALVRQSGLLAKLAPVVKAFIASPGSSITVSFAPPTPLPLPAIAQAAEEKPETLVDLLGLTVDTTGKLPTTGDTKPAPPATQEKSGGDPRPTAPAQ